MGACKDPWKCAVALALNEASAGKAAWNICDGDEAEKWERGVCVQSFTLCDALEVWIDRFDSHQQTSPATLIVREVDTDPNVNGEWENTIDLRLESVPVILDPDYRTQVLAPTKVYRGARVAWVDGDAVHFAMLDQYMGMKASATHAPLDHRWTVRAG